MVYFQVVLVMPWPYRTQCDHVCEFGSAVVDKVPWHAVPAPWMQTQKRNMCTVMQTMRNSQQKTLALAPELQKKKKKKIQKKKPPKKRFFQIVYQGPSAHRSCSFRTVQTGSGRGCPFFFHYDAGRVRSVLLPMNFQRRSDAQTCKTNFQWEFLDFGL